MLLNDRLGPILVKSRGHTSSLHTLLEGFFFTICLRVQFVCLNNNSIYLYLYQPQHLNILCMMIEGTQPLLPKITEMCNLMYDYMLPISQKEHELKPLLNARCTCIKNCMLQLHKTGICWVSSKTQLKIILQRTFHMDAKKPCTRIYKKNWQRD